LRASSPWHYLGRVRWSGSYIMVQGHSTTISIMDTVSWLKSESEVWKKTSYSTTSCWWSSGGWSFLVWVTAFEFPSVLWHCCLADRNVIGTAENPAPIFPKGSILGGQLSPKFLFWGTLLNSGSGVRLNENWKTGKWWYWVIDCGRVW